MIDKLFKIAETLGCTSPVLPTDCKLAVFVADGRFHMESVMIQNPAIPMFRYDPYAKVLSSEGYDIELMKETRLSVIIIIFIPIQMLPNFLPVSVLVNVNLILYTRKSIKLTQNAKVIGLILGTLGRQGNIQLFNRLKMLASKHSKVVIPFLMAEINLQKLAILKDVDVNDINIILCAFYLLLLWFQAWVQVACPRLSIDWGGDFDKVQHYILLFKTIFILILYIANIITL